MKKLTLDQKEEIIEKYKTGNYTFADLGREYNVVKSTIRVFLTKNGFKAKSMSEIKRIHALNEHYLDDIDCEGKAWVCGWIASDGYNQIDRHVVKLALQEKDKVILEIVRDLFESEQPLAYDDPSNRKDGLNRQNLWRLTLNSKHLSQRVADIGFGKNKTFNLDFSIVDHIPDNLMNHFIRGFLEGDGTISDGLTAIVGTEKFCIGLQRYLQDKLNIYSQVDDLFPKKIFKLGIYRQQDLKKFLDWIYHDATLYLDRKYQSYLSFQKEYKRKQDKKTFNRKLRIAALKLLDQNSSYTMVDIANILGVPRSKIVFVLKKMKV